MLQYVLPILATPAGFGGIDQLTYVSRQCVRLWIQHRTVNIFFVRPSRMCAARVFVTSNGDYYYFVHPSRMWCHCRWREKAAASNRLEGGGNSGQHIFALFRLREKKEWVTFEERTQFIPFP
jgi:hypothetical protein